MKRSLILFLLFAVSSQAYEAGTSGLLFLRLGAGARAGGMGEAHTAVSSGGTALYWNPAGLSLSSADLYVSHKEWILSTRQEFLGMSYPLQGGERGALGFGLTALTMDEMELYEGPGDPVGHFSAFDMAFHLAWGGRLDFLPEGLHLGMGTKWIYSRLHEDSARGLLFDAGALLETKIPGLTFAGVLQHFGQAMKYREETFSAPLTMKAGLAWRPPMILDGSALLAYDLLLVGDGDISSDDVIGEAKAMNTRHHLGFEFDYQQIASLRMGYKYGYESQGLTAGGSIHWGRYYLDYAFMNLMNDLGNSHHFGISVDLH